LWREPLTEFLAWWKSSRLQSLHQF
jgi:hypothetical protein